MPKDLNFRRTGFDFRRLNKSKINLKNVINNDMKNTTRRNWWVVWGLSCGDGVVHSVYDFCEDWDIGSEKCQEIVIVEW